MSILRFLAAFRAALAERLLGGSPAPPPEDDPPVPAIPVIPAAPIILPEPEPEPPATAKPLQAPEALVTATGAPVVPAEPAPEVAAEPVVAAPPKAKRPRKPKAPKPPKATPAQVAEPAPACLQPRDDPEADALRQKIAGLEIRIADLAARKAVIDEAVLAFQIAQYEAVGQTLENCLRLRAEFQRLKADRSGTDEDRQAERDAAADYAACHPQGADEADALAALDDEERAELKQRYRAAAMRCHPDRVPEADKPAAEGVFLRLQQAYLGADLPALRAVCRELDGAARHPDAEALPGSAALRRHLSDLQDHAADLIFAVQSGQLDPVYRKAIRPADWDAEFAETCERLEGECEALERQIRILSRY